jgi:type IV pilus modification protein PilV
MHRQSGYSLIEVLVGIMIFAVGMMALAQLQTNLSKSSADANARTVAANIAEEEIESVRTFGQLTASETVDAFDNIVSGTRTEQRGNINYTVTSTVTDYYWNPDLPGFQETKPSTDMVFADMKRLEVTVSWATGDSAQSYQVDQSNAVSGMSTGSVTVVDLISSFTTASGAKVVLNSMEDSLYAPPVDYNPGQNPDIISIQLGNNKFKESTTPLPDVVRQDALVETRFDVVTYSQNDAGATFLRREEFRALSCECTLRIPTSSDQGGRRPTVWEGTEYAEGEWVSKPYGESAITFQSTYCDMCCRDHHDGGVGSEDVAADPGRSRYNPFRSSADYYTEGALAGDHKHYSRNRLGELVLAENDGDRYTEACRLVRKDGFFRIAQDMRQEGFNAFPADFLDDSSEVGIYSDYVTAAVSAFEHATDPTNSQSPTNPYETGPPALTRPEDMATPVVFPASTTENATTLPTVSGSTEQQLRSRGIYIDYLTDVARERINCLDNLNDPADCEVPEVTSALEIIPFYDVQLTWLARWNETPNNIPVDVSNEAIADNNTHDRGTAVMSADVGSSTVTTSVHGGNLGLTGTDPIDPWYAYEEKFYSMYVDVDVDSPPPELSGIIISGSISSAVPGVKASDVEIEGTGAQCDRTNMGYECNLEVGASNPRIKIYNYFRNLQVLIGCSDVLRVHGTEHSSSTSSSADNWTRFWLPKVDTSGANIVIQEGEDCVY